MNSYLLLRSNKESGPYTREELIANGLKPYDLVWLKGKSAAWRYPSEIDELKAYAPAVEEQPYDRFYKKEPEQTLPIETQKVATPIIVEAAQPLIITKQQEQVEAVAKKVEPVYEIKESESAYLPKIVKEPELVSSQQGKKSVFVTMPGQKTAQAPVPEPKKPAAAVPKPLPIEDYAAPTIAITETPVTSQVKYSQPLDEIKEMYVKTLYERKTKIARKSVVMGYMKKAAVIAGLVGLGVLAGFIIKPKGDKTPALTNQSLSNNSAVLSVPDGETTETKSNVVTAPESNTVEAEQKIKEQPRPIQSVLPEKKYLALRQDELAVPRAELPLPKRNTDQVEENREFEQKQLFSGAEKNPVTGERTKTKRENTSVASTENVSNNNVIEEANPDKGSFKVNRPTTSSAKIKGGLADLVSVRSNDYKIVAFGGIRDLRLTVTNNSRFELDNVIVELQYLKPSEQPLRTENIEFKFIGPNESATIRVPDTNRGIKVAYKIISIGSKQSRDGVAGN